MSFIFAVFTIFFFVESLKVFLTGTQTGLNDVHHIVAQLLTLIDKVHIDGAYGVRVLVVVDVYDVLLFQLVAVVVDLILDVECVVDIE